MKRLGPWQFSLKSLMIGVTLAILALPLLPFILLFAIWYAIEPPGLFLDAVNWFGNREPRKKIDDISAR